MYDVIICICIHALYCVNVESCCNFPRPRLNQGFSRILQKASGASKLASIIHAIPDEFSTREPRVHKFHVSCDSSYYYKAIHVRVCVCGLCNSRQLLFWGGGVVVGLACCCCTVKKKCNADGNATARQVFVPSVCSVCSLRKFLAKLTERATATRQPFSSSSSLQKCNSAALACDRDDDVERGGGGGDAGGGQVVDGVRCVSVFSFA